MSVTGQESNVRRQFCGEAGDNATDSSPANTCSGASCGAIEPAYVYSSPSSVVASLEGRLLAIEKPLSECSQAEEVNPFSAAQPIDLATQLPPTWFNSIRNEENRLDSSPVPLQFRLTKPLADKVEAEVQALMRQQSVSANDAILRVMQSCMKVDVVYYDGQPVTIFCPDSAVHETLVAAPQIVSAEFLHPQRSLTVRAEQNCSTRSTRASANKQCALLATTVPDSSDSIIVQVYVTRKLPLSSAHANRFFRLGFLWMGHGVEHVLFTRAISVLAKQAPGAERKQKYFASHKAEPSRTCWVLQRAASSRGMDLSKSFESASAPAPMGVGGYKRARGGEALSQNSASFARVAAGEFAFSAARTTKPQPALAPVYSTTVPYEWDCDDCSSVCALGDPALAIAGAGCAACQGGESDDTASDVRSVSSVQPIDDCCASVSSEMRCIKAEADAAAAAQKPCGDPLARFFKQGRCVPAPAPLSVPCHIPSVSRCASPLQHAFSSELHSPDYAVPPRHTPHQAPVIATQPAVPQAVSTLQVVVDPFSRTAKPLFQIPTPPAALGEFAGLASGLADMTRQDSLERGHSLLGGDEQGSHGRLPFADLLNMAPASQDASLPELARSYSARSGMSVGSGFNFAGQ